MMWTPRADRELFFATELDRSRQELDRFAMEVASLVNRIAGHLRVGAPDIEIAQLASDIGITYARTRTMRSPRPTASARRPSGDAARGSRA